MNAWCLHMRGSDELENKKVLPLLRLPAAFPGHTIPLSCFRCHRVLPIRSNEEREKNGGRKKKKSESSFSDFITRANQATKVLSSLSFRESMERHTEVETETVNFEGDIPPVPVLNSTSYISHSWRSTHLTNDTTSSRVHACQTRRSRSDEKRKATYFDPFPFFSSSFFPSLSFSISFHNLTTWRGYIYMYIYVCTFTVNGNKHEVHTMMK